MYPINFSVGSKYDIELRSFKLSFTFVMTHPTWNKTTSWPDTCGHRDDVLNRGACDQRFFCLCGGTITQTCLATHDTLQRNDRPHTNFFFYDGLQTTGQVLELGDEIHKKHLQTA
eukprot:m.1137525 g.1137525  ORF g.1137525 m.1137525 type:complete len:115 (+) comp24435_c0_seq31:50-394(+)